MPEWFSWIRLLQVLGFCAVSVTLLALLFSLCERLRDRCTPITDLQLVDYRLPQGRTGIDALVALRARWPGLHLPAIVITGSSLTGHEDEAVQHDYHLLIKPVLPNKLRAMIAFKLNVR